MRRDTGCEQGHDLVILVEDRGTAWVFWRWGWPVAYGLVVGGFGPRFSRDKDQEDSDARNMGGFNAWVVLACDAIRSFCAGGLPFYDAEVLAAADPDDTVAVRALADESIASLTKEYGYEPPPIVRRAIAESLCIGIAVYKNDAEPKGGA